jgi:BolA family transcriptional regulator, general stress-responsive regulator
MDRVAWIRETLAQAFAPAHLQVDDDSAKHAGHAGARGGGGHYNVLIVSEAFVGLDLVTRQRRVYAALGDAMRREIHALALRTLTPAEWERSPGPTN